MSGIKNTLKNAKKEEITKDWLKNHGQTEGGAFVAGVRVIKPLDVDGRPLPSGTNYTLPEGNVTIYDGNVRYIDEEVFKHDVEQFARRQRHVDKMVKAFLTSGDAVCRKYIGYHFDWLKYNEPSDKAADALEKYMLFDGIDRATARQIINQIQKHDGTPDHINSFTNPSTEYTQCLYKLMTILKYCCIIFMGKEGVTAPEIGETDNIPFEDPDGTSGKAAREERNKKRSFKSSSGIKEGSSGGN